MGRSSESTGKKGVRIKNEKKRKDKEKKRIERKQQSRDGNDLDSMIAYVDEFGNITSTPPDLTQKQAINPDDIKTGVPRNVVTDTNETIRKGIVTFFDESKGYGFIKDSESGQSIFVHINSLTEQIKENNKVSFEIIKGTKGPNAINVKVERD